jgi:hypothetical protein
MTAYVLAGYIAVFGTLAFYASYLIITMRKTATKVNAIEAAIERASTRANQ